MNSFKNENMSTLSRYSEQQSDDNIDCYSHPPSMTIPIQTMNPNTNSIQVFSV